MGGGSAGATGNTYTTTLSARYNFFNTNQDSNRITYERYYVIDFDTYDDSYWSNQVLALTTTGASIHYKMYYSIHEETINGISRYYAKILAIGLNSNDEFGLDMLDLVANINNSIVNRLGQLNTYYADQGQPNSV